jgi:hypothetical protein
MSLARIALILVAVFSLASTGWARPQRQRGRAHASRKHAPQKNKKAAKPPKAETRKSSADMLAGLPGF